MPSQCRQLRQWGKYEIGEECQEPSDQTWVPFVDIHLVNILWTSLMHHKQYGV